ncbi:ribonuclease domain-containing protein [Paenibacillus pinihumi]|uniref:ribonuclease domain-containing protein n=1 Tax=Paenibacillus pinihumi TaxID=669462 RepID=UPI000411D26D|nr:ribonuclease domain-containing protein [Paenibacillus pinihumi]
MMFNAILKQMGRWTRSSMAVMITLLVMVLAGCGAISDLASNPPQSTGTSQGQENAQGPLTSFQAVSDYIREHGKLPANYMTKKEASQLGWVPSKGNLNQVAPGKSIGGDRFGNREGLLPKAKNRIWYEADINYKKGSRGADRILFSSDGLIYMTTDHYKSFTDITKEGSVPE